MRIIERTKNLKFTIVFLCFFSSCSDSVRMGSSSHFQGLSTSGFCESKSQCIRSSATNSIPSLSPASGSASAIAKSESSEYVDVLPPSILKYVSATSCPTLISFVYASCKSKNRCPAVVREIGELLRISGDSKLSLSVILVSLNPRYDTVESMERFAIDNGLTLGKFNVVVDERISNEDLTAVGIDVARFAVPNAVSHGLNTIVVDASGNILVRKRVRLWRAADLYGEIMKAERTP